MLRAVNVSGVGKLPKDDLKAMGERCGFERCRTFINSGNLLFATDLGEAEAKSRLEARTAEYFGRPVPVYVRSADEMATIAGGNPFTDDRPSWTFAYFLDDPIEQALIDEARDIAGERLALGPRVIYVSYGAGIRTTRLKLPLRKRATARNMNSVARLATLLAAAP